MVDQEAVSLWKSLVQQLEGLRTQDPAKVAVPNTLGRQIEQLQARRLPLETWKLLVDDEHVPLKLAGVFKHLLQDSLSRGCVNDATHTACGVLGGLLRDLSFADAAPAPSVDDSAAAPQPEDSSRKKAGASLRTDAIEQLQAAGLLQQLPDLLHAAAALLQRLPVPPASGSTGSAAGPTVPAAAGPEAVSPSPKGEPRDAPGAEPVAAEPHASSSTTSSSGTAESLEVPLAGEARPLGFSAALLAFTQHVTLLQLEETDLQILDAAACLGVACMRRLTAVLAAHPEGLPPCEEASGGSDFSTACYRLFGNIQRQMNAANLSPQQLLAAINKQPDIAVAVSLLGFVMFARSLLPEGLLCTDDGSGSDTAAAAMAHVAAAVREQNPFAWLAGSQLPQPSSPEVAPAQHSALQTADPCWQVTGVSLEAVAWMAAHDPLDLSSQLLTAAQGTAALLRCYGAAQAQAGGRRDTAPPSQLSNCAPWHPAHSLLLTQLLLCSLQPAAKACMLEVDTPCEGITMNADFASFVAGLAARAVSITTQHQAAGSGGCVGLLGAWLESVLPVMLQLAQHAVEMLDQTDAGPDDGAITSTIVGAAGSSSSSSTVAPDATSSAANKAEADSFVVKAAWALLQLLADSCRAHFTIPAALKPLLTQPPPGTAAGPDAAAAISAALSANLWLRHGGEMCGVLEGWLRVLGRRPVTEATAEAVQSVCGPLLGPNSFVSKASGPLLVSGVFAAPASPEQVQVFSTLCSYLKLAQLMRPVKHGWEADEACWQAACCVKAALGAAATAQGSLLHGSRGAASKAGLLWLVLAGRACLHWAAGLQKMQSQSNLVRMLSVLRRVQPMGPEGADEFINFLPLSDWSPLKAAAAGRPPLAVGLLDSCRAWLQQEGRVAQLDAAGYPASTVLRQLQEVLALQPRLLHAPGDEAALAACSLLVQRLQGLGEALNTLAVPHACNNPRCGSMVGATERAAVSGQGTRGCRCSGCRVAHYCCRSPCQKEHWAQHKSVCKAIGSAKAEEQAGDTA